MSLKILSSNPLIFPVFKDLPFPKKDSQVYAGIALKIFEKLSLQDLCQINMVCKEWKQLIDTSNLFKQLYQQLPTAKLHHLKQPIAIPSVANNKIINASYSLGSLPSHIYHCIFLSFDSLTPDDLRKILDVRTCAQVFKRNMPSNFKFLTYYQPLKLQPYLCKLANYLERLVHSMDRNVISLSRDRLEAAEEAYKLLLKHAVEKKDSIQESLYLEILGDVYYLKGKREQLVQAAGIYIYSICLAPKDRQGIIKEKIFNVQRILIELCEGEPINLEQMQKQFEDNRELLKNFRKGIKEKIHTLTETPSSEQVRELYCEIAQGVKVFFKSLVDQANDVLGPPPCEYAMIGFGSLAREEMTPYSDLEFGILISDDNTKNRKYFKHLTTLIHLKVINLGETILPALNIPCLKAIDFFDSITPRGFAFDGAGVEGKGCKTPFGNGTTFELIQTPEKMAQYIGKDDKGNWWHTKEPHLPMELLTFTHLLGSINLTRQYSQKVQEKLNMPYQESLDLRQYLAKQHLFEADMLTFNPGLGDLERQGMLFRVKNDFYRFPHLALDRLALLNKIEASDTLTRIDELNKQEVLTQAASEKLRDWMSIALFMRLKTYSHYQAQQEMMNPLIKPFGFEDPVLIEKQLAVDQKTLEKIKQIYYIFIPFYNAIHQFLSDNEDSLKLSDLSEESPQTQGDIAARLFQYEHAKNFYLQALQVDPRNAGVLNALGLIYHEQEQSDQALEWVNKALEIDKRHMDETYSSVLKDYSNLGQIYHDQRNIGKKHSMHEACLNLVRDYSNLGQIYQNQENLEKAIECFNEALNICEHIPYGKNSYTMSSLYNNLGMTYEAQGKLIKATKHINQAIKIDEKLFGKNHPEVAIYYNNLGMIREAQGNLEDAAKYVNQALEIDKKHFGETHPHVAIGYSNLAKIYKKQGNIKKAFEYVNQALMISQKLFGETHPTTATFYNNLGHFTKLKEN
ncbi:hypothetical protein DB41_IB00020 [Neochlamydia sp. TUME1]|uniref:tetratricopeptide repeat protein n=1 Tax=Neochlamydia sp. TUME1 TaxID=1478174 RepID=UPI00057E049B|nr:tetratricopeptide repeat protein [Neochlamydia sp. TUME1]KIC74869.1 hypothetical protein DB41_IB00020 [Neochlamydia sp. TUME1]